MLPFDRRKTQANTGERENTEIHLLDYLKIVQKRMWISIILFAVIVVTVTIGTFLTRPVYKATARVVLEQKELNVGIKQLMSEKQNTMDFYTNQCEIIKSRTIAKKVIDTLNLKNQPLNNPHKNVENYPLPPANQQDPSVETCIIDGFLSAMSVSLMRNSGIVNISYAGYDPRQITEIANAIVKTYIEQDWEKRYNVAKDTLEWLNKQMKDVKTTLEESELALQKYKKENDFISVESVKNVGSEDIADASKNIVLQKLMDLNSILTSAKAERIKSETLYNKLKIPDNPEGKYELVQSVPSIVGNSLIQKLKEDYAKAESDLSLYSKRYGPKHPKIIQLKVILNTIRSNIDKEVERTCESIVVEYEIAKNREETLQSILEQQKGDVFSQGDKAIQYGVLKREVDVNRQMYETLLTRMKETNLTEDLKTSDIRVLDYAEVPLKPYKPKKSLNILLGIIVGLTCGVGIAFIMEYMDNTIKTQEDVEKYLGTPLLGVLGHISSRDKHFTANELLVTHHLPKHPITEAIKSIRTKIIFSHPENPKKTILVSSASPCEGKTLLAINLAIVMAQTGKKVLLIDADFRNPTLHELFRVNKSSGLSNLLINSSDLRTVTKNTQISNVYVIPCGPIPPNPSELLSSSAMVECLKTLKSEYEWIIIDSPPLLTFTDASILARIVDGIVYVIRGSKTARTVAQKGAFSISAVRDKVLGVVINDLDLSRDEHYGHYRDKKESEYE